MAERVELSDRDPLSPLHGAAWPEIKETSTCGMRTADVVLNPTLTLGQPLLACVRSE